MLFSYRTPNNRKNEAHSSGCRSLSKIYFCLLLIEYKQLCAHRKYTINNSNHHHIPFSLLLKIKSVKFPWKRTAILSFYCGSSSLHIGIVWLCGWRRKCKRERETNNAMRLRAIHLAQISEQLF